MPIAATSQSIAAVVSPRTERPWRMIAPAPRKPMPLTICAAIRVGSTRGDVNAYALTRVKSAEPTQTTRCVRRPAWRSRSSRSRPIAPPSPAATVSRSRMCGHDGALEIAADSIFLLLADQPAAALREVEQLAEELARERILLRRRLHLDQPPVAGHDDVHVGVGGRVLGVVEVEHRRP